MAVRKVRKVPSKMNPYADAASSSGGSASFVVGAEATNVVTVNVQLKDARGVDMAARCNVGWYISTDANGDNIAAATSGTIAAGTDGVVINTLDKQAGIATTEADGDLDFVITDTAVRTLYLVLIMPDGSLSVSAVITFA